MKILFLDIDGVLIRFGNTTQVRKSRADKGTKGGVITELDTDLVENLINIVVQTGAKIVISSSWRRNKILMGLLRDQFYQHEIQNKNHSDNLWHRVISKTPHSLDHGRGNEILHWINWHNETCANGDHIKKWIAIDDDSFDMKQINRLGRFVHTKTKEGLTKEKMNECIDLLNGSTKPKNSLWTDYMGSKT